MSEMERDLISRARGASSCFSGFDMMSPSSCFTVQEEMEYSRIHRCSSSSDKRRRWRNLLMRISTRVVIVKKPDITSECFQAVRREPGNKSTRIRTDVIWN
ncbi:hypothetical protein V6N13_044656 [Hibiscus sabdariffa]|uniref:Uncharacterized protein n=1 Tax=Hibiscus sabdariffa TaxID=183260 RepID=A0ABR2RIW0_9ROSI